MFPKIDAFLFLEERNVILSVVLLFIVGIFVDQAFVDEPTHRSLDHPWNVLHLELGIKMPSGLHHDEGVHLAESLAAGNTQADLRLETAVEDVAFDDPQNIVRAARLAPRSGANHQGGLVVLDLLVVLNALAKLDELRDR